MDVTKDEYKLWVAGTVSLACNLMTQICPDAEEERAKAGGLDFKDRVVCGLAVWSCLKCAKAEGISEIDAVGIIMDAVNEWEGEPGYLSMDFSKAILQHVPEKKEEES
jgi:hypothetical protein